MYTWRELVELYRLTMPPQNIEPRYNIAPTTTIDVIVPTSRSMNFVRMRWGLVPSWWKKSLKEVPSTHNARGETVATKPMFRTAFKRSRCLIPASGFYEWQTVGGTKQPFYITASDAPILSIAGLWDSWTNPSNGEQIRSCTMIVTAANEFMEPIHDRIPVFIQPDDFEPWLSGEAGTELLAPPTNDYLRAWPVSRRVNAVRNEGAELIGPIDPAA
jgi:putative SOS response-associated peptidase YedK